MKTTSTFFTATVRQAVAANAASHEMARAERERLIAEASPWLARSEEQLWARVFTPSLPRSWMVWSNGHCPSCRQAVVMYEWIIDALDRPWKVKCPQCGDIFPKNDFGAYHRSGLDESGLFDAARADRALLFNAEHPAPDDPMHTFGVDDGQGYIDGDKKWRFIAAYLIYGDWKQFIVAGIEKLAAAFVATGDMAYSRRALVLLHRLADVFPGFDFATQGEVYETRGHNGYVSTWHDANAEHTQLIIAYDQVFDGLRGDPHLIAFLADKAAERGGTVAATTPETVQRHIEDRIFRDALCNRQKIHTNFPGMHTLVITMMSVLDWPASREKVYDYWVDLLQRSTSVDGVTGEKGLQSYSCYTIALLARAASLFLLSDRAFIATMMRRVPAFACTYRFHIDTWCGDGRFYPDVGDGRSFGSGEDHYLGLALGQEDKATGKFVKRPGVRPSMDRLLYECAAANGDADLLRVLVRENGGAIGNCIFDLTFPDMAAAEAHIQRVIDEQGRELRLSSVDLRQWHLGILRSGEPGKERAVWMDYDSGGGHSHQDAMNLGLFAHGMNLMPDAGYPPVQFGGWETQKAKWYYHTAAHNSVVVDGNSQRSDYAKPIAGETRIWTQTPTIKTMRMSAPAVYGIAEYDRTVLLIDIDADDFYVVDHFRVVGGSDHAKFIHSHFGALATHGLTLSPCADFGFGTLLRNFQRDANPAPGWAGDWTVEDRNGLLARPIDLHLRYTDLTLGAAAHTHEGWYVQGVAQGIGEHWVPRLMVRRQGTPGAPLASTFVGVIEPYIGQRKIQAIRRIDGNAARPDGAEQPDAVIEVQLADGRRDVIVLQPGRGPGIPAVQVHGHGAFLRYDAAGRIVRLATIHARHLKAGDIELRIEPYSRALELAFEERGGSTHARVVSSDLSEQFAITQLTQGGTNLLE